MLKQQQLRAKALGFTLAQMIELGFQLLEEKKRQEEERDKMLEEMWEERFTLEGHGNQMEVYV